ncbi:MAG: hypothetical protein SPJ57_01260 [Candidatus Methanomethylophilaceae archaeon]|nr:hypothetical protein [Candidatus Methanomethylophilaceae archaeon]
MKYDNVIQGTFIDRPNRFIANVLLADDNGSGVVARCHVKNTGQCNQLLTGGITSRQSTLFV